MKKFLKYGIWEKILLFIFIATEIILLTTGIWWICTHSITENGSIALVVVVILHIIITAITSIFISFTQSEPDYKLAWILTLAIIPVGGWVLYVMYGYKRLSLREKRLVCQLLESYRINTTEPETRQALDELDMDSNCISKYIENCTGGGIYQDSKVDFFPWGEDAFADMVIELKKAKHYIFLEYFILEDGLMWNSILEILEEKANEGVDVRLIYDDLGNWKSLPINYDQTLRKKGIKAYKFRPLRPIIDMRLNNRDHRKIMLIDGHTVYTGGINLSDEYINEKQRFGVWKDNAIKITGKAVYTFTMMFLGTWHKQFDRDNPVDLYYYSPETFIDEIGGYPKNDGFVQPYGTVPFDYASVGQGVYTQLLSRSKKYCYITTPYLIIDGEMTNALRDAALAGVDVRIITPGIPDKKLVYSMTRQNYGKLLAAGVRIYEYKPGFIHAKEFICDDNQVAIGTINLDFRSLYLHYENGVFISNSSCVKEIKDDFIETCKSCEEITDEKYKEIKKKNILKWPLLKLISPFL